MFRSKLGTVFLPRPDIVTFSYCHPCHRYADTSSRGRTRNLKPVQVHDWTFFSRCYVTPPHHRQHTVTQFEWSLRYGVPLSWLELVMGIIKITTLGARSQFLTARPKGGFRVLVITGSQYRQHYSIVYAPTRLAPADWSSPTGIHFLCCGAASWGHPGYGLSQRIKVARPLAAFDSTDTRPHVQPAPPERPFDEETSFLLSSKAEYALTIESPSSLSSDAHQWSGPGTNMQCTPSESPLNSPPLSLFLLSLGFYLKLSPIGDGCGKSSEHYN